MNCTHQKTIRRHPCNSWKLGTLTSKSFAHYLHFTGCSLVPSPSIHLVFHPSWDLELVFTGSSSLGVAVLCLTFPFSFSASLYSVSLTGGMVSGARRWPSSRPGVSEESQDYQRARGRSLPAPDSSASPSRSAPSIGPGLRQWFCALLPACVPARGSLGHTQPPASRGHFYSPLSDRSQTPGFLCILCFV